MKFIGNFIFIFFIFGICNYIKSNNIQVNNVSLVEQNSTSSYVFAQFDISWENSWRTSTFESNWDAAWIFIKYRQGTTNPWYHATLNTTGHTEPSGSTITTPTDGKGVFLYKSSTGIGNVSYSGVKLRWNYGVDGLTDLSNVEICVMAIEMVYIPQGSFSLGSGGTETDAFYSPFVVTGTTIQNASSGYSVSDILTVSGGTFNTQARLTVSSIGGSGEITGVTITDGGSYNIIPSNSVSVTGGTGVGATFDLTWNLSTNSFMVSSENAITVGTANGNLYYSNTGNGGDQAGNLSINYPKGYSAFYCMKYEISQHQYVDFLNMLTRTQQLNRISASTVGNFMCNNNATATPQNRNGIKVRTDPGGINAFTFGNDLDNDNIYNEANDGLYISCNWLSWSDGIAYADWAGLRPMTETEFEKAGRGTRTAFSNEYLWGNTTIIQTTGITNSGLTTEIPTNAGANCVYGNNAAVQGPMRAGCFAGLQTSRQNSGASFYGVFELSGNVGERVVSVGNATARNFTGINGDGILDVNGNANEINWPDASGSSYRGGSWVTASGNLTISNRSYGLWNDNNRYNYSGFRCIRTSP